MATRTDPPGAPGPPAHAGLRRITVAYHPRYDRRDPAIIVGALRRTVWDDGHTDLATITADEYHRAADLPTAERHGDALDDTDAIAYYCDTLDRYASSDGNPRHRRPSDGET
jgi:hypothetical protein